MATDTHLQERSTGQAIWRGLLCKCPHCGHGKLFRSYLKVVDNCDACGEQLNLHRADDFPPYIAIMIVGHVLVAVMLHMEISGGNAYNPLVYLLAMVPLAIILPLLMLPSIKGGIVGFQWAKHMHGFGHKA